MTFTAYEQSENSGFPLEGYDIAMGATHWRITPGAVAFTYLGNVYTPAVCKRSAMKQSSQINKDSIEIELPRGHALGCYCVSGIPDFEVTATIIRGHNDFFIRFWSGTCSKITINSEGKPVCLFEPVTSDFPVCGGRRRCQKLCDLTLYEDLCGVNKENYKVEGVIDSINGLTVTSSSFLDANFSVGQQEEDINYGDLTSLEGCVYNGSSFLYDKSRYHYNNAFDNNPGGIGWLADYDNNSNCINQWASCQWTESKIINRIKIQPCPYVDRYKWAARYLKVEASNNGTSWAKIPVKTWISNCQQYNIDEVELFLQRSYSQWAEIELNNVFSYYYYRLFCYSGWDKHMDILPRDIRSPRPAEGIGLGEVEMTYDAAGATDYPELVTGLGSGGTIKIGDEERNIMSHSGSTITIDRLFRDAAVNDAFVAYAGCDHSPNTCRYKFGNIINYGGREHLSVSNPYVRNIYY